MKVINIVMIGLIFFILTACGNQSTINPSAKQKEETPTTSTPETNETASFDPPEVANISFHPLELIELLEGEPLESWEYVKSVPLSLLIEKDITLHVYKDTDPNSLCYYSTVSLLEYDNKTYKLNECTSDSFLQKSPEEIGAFYILEHTFIGQEKRLIFHSSFELFANGPGRMQYIVYDVSEEKLLTFEEWGIPIITDLEVDEKSLVIQFPGLHMHSPDATIFRWHNEQLERSQSIKDALGLTYQQDYIQFIDDKSLFIAYSALDRFSVEFVEIQYRYENGKLVKN